MGGIGEVMVVLVYEWCLLFVEGQVYIFGLCDIYEQMWFDVLGEVWLVGYCQGDLFILWCFFIGVLFWIIIWFCLEGLMSFDQFVEEVLVLVIKDV